MKKLFIHFKTLKKNIKESLTTKTTKTKQKRSLSKRFYCKFNFWI